VNLEDQVAQLRKAVEAAAAERARQQAVYDHALERAGTAAKAIKTEFGCSTLEEAEALAVKLEADAAQEVARAQELLRQAAGGGSGEV
jgi:hypothetical protein